MTLKKRTFLVYLVLYLTALMLTGATHLDNPDTPLVRLLSFIWSLMPSQNARWFMLSLIMLIILMALIFVAGYFILSPRLENLLEHTGIIKN
jgi:threonine/homoserine/homoserine lactone efflux protein